MGNTTPSLSSSQLSSDRMNRSAISDPPNKLMLSMIQRVHNQLENTSFPLKNSDSNSKFPLSNIKQDYNSPLMTETNENYFSANENTYQQTVSTEKMNPSNKISKKKKFIEPKIKINTNFQQKFFNLPLEIRYHIISFLIDEYPILISVSPLWYCKVNETLDEMLQNIDNSFIKQHMDILALKNAYFTHTVLCTGFRIDRNIVAEAFDNLANKTIILGYDYMNKREELCTEFQFDLISSNKRTIWVYKEDCQHNFDKFKFGLIQPIMPIILGDSIKLAVNIYNIRGLLDISKIKWRKPIINYIPEIPRNFGRKTKNFDINRICEVEFIHDDWIDYKFFEHPFKKKLDCFQPYLIPIEIKCAGVESGILTTRVKFMACQLGFVYESYEILGVNLEIVDEKSEIISEVKKKGLVFDLEDSLMIRIGETVVFYLSSGF